MFAPWTGQRLSNEPDIFYALFSNGMILGALDYWCRSVLPMLPAMWPLVVQPMQNLDAAFALTYLCDSIEENHDCFFFFFKYTYCQFWCVMSHVSHE